MLANAVVLFYLSHGRSGRMRAKLWFEFDKTKFKPHQFQSDTFEWPQRCSQRSPYDYRYPIVIVYWIWVTLLVEALPSVKSIVHNQTKKHNCYTLSMICFGTWTIIVVFYAALDNMQLVECTMVCSHTMIIVIFWHRNQMFCWLALITEVVYLTFAILL